MTTTDQLTLAAAVLDDLAAGRSLGQSDAIAEALTLDTMVRTYPAPSRELLDAAAGLELLATGRLDLDDVGRAHAGVLAQHVRSLGQ